MTRCATTHRAVIQALKRGHLRAQRAGDGEVDDALRHDGDQHGEAQQRGLGASPLGRAVPAAGAARVGRRAGHQSASRQSTPGSDDAVVRADVVGAALVPSRARRSVGCGAAVDSARARVRRRATGTAGVDPVVGHGRSRWSRSAARMRSASSASLAVMPPRTRLRAAGVRSVTGHAGGPVQLEEVEAHDRDVQAAEDGDLLGVPLPSTPTNQWPRAHTYVPTAPATTTTRAATATRRSRSGRRRAEGPPPVGGVGGGAGGGCGSASAARPAAERGSTWRWPTLSPAAPSMTGSSAAAAAGVLDDVGDDHGDVVRAAAAQRQLDEPVGGRLGIGVLQRLGEGLLADHAGEAVGAQQVPVAGARLAHGEVGLDLLAVEGAQQQRALGVAVGLLRGDPAVVDQRLHERVVVGDLGELRRRAPGRRGSRRRGTGPAGRRRRGSR